MLEDFFFPVLKAAWEPPLSKNHGEPRARFEWFDSGTGQKNQTSVSLIQLMSSLVKILREAPNYVCIKYPSFTLSYNQSPLSYFTLF